MRRSPGTTLLIVATLAAGIGANVTLVGATTHALLSPPKEVREPDRVVRLLLVAWDQRGGSTAIGAANYPQLLDLQREATAFAGVAGYTTRNFSVGTGADALEVRAALVSADYFRVLGAMPVIGRAFSADDEFPTGALTGGTPLAVISHHLWQRRFGGEAGAIGRALRVGGILYTVIGVMPRDFTGVQAESPDLWLPITVAAADPAAFISLADRGRYALSVVARLRPAVTQRVAERQVSSIWKSANQAMGAPEEPVRVVAASLIRARSPDAPREVRVMLWLTGVSALILLIACANVANILLSRAFARRHEVALRLALGADRGRLARQMLTESILLALVSAAGALAVAGIAAPLLSQFVFGQSIPRFATPGITAFSLLVGLGTGVLISLAPVIQGFRDTQLGVLRSGDSRGSHRGSRIRFALLATQSALCMAMLVIAGLFALSLRRATKLDLGLDIKHTIRALVKLDGLSLSNEAVDATYDEFLRRVRSLRGVEAAALASSDPYAAGRAVAAHTPERDADYLWPPTGTQVAIEAAVGDGFFRAVGARSLRGRDFEATDDRGSARVAIVNSPLARILYPTSDALGQCVILPKRFDDRGGSCVTIVGVLSGVWYTTIANREKPMVYVPLAQREGYDGVWRPQGLFVRTSGEPQPLVELIRRELQSVRSDLPAVKVTLMRDAVVSEIRPWQLGAGMFGLFGLLALVVAVVGLYGVVVFAAAQRRFEIAVRLALGARPRDILVEVAGRSLASLSLGLAIGTTAALLTRRWVGPLLFQTAPDDPGLIVATAALLLSVGFLATLVPTVRALRLDAATILKAP